MDYQKIGLKCGLEIHQQLDTDRKLFCDCMSDLSEDKPMKTVERKMRAVTGETGKIDVAAAHEAGKGLVFEYQVFPSESCLVELDEEPPKQINTEALSIGLQIAILLNCHIPDEVHIMRKTVVDGSNTSGFQRTAVIGLNGFIETGFGKVGITNVSIEEDSCQIIGKEGNKIIYGLDRLGIPLIEIGTGPDIKTPEQAKETAEKIGFILRSTGSVKRGLGMIRQDLNVSVIGGNRIEIKGVQDLKSIPKFVEGEAGRQLKLIEIYEKVRGLKEIGSKETDLSEVFKNTKSKLVSTILSSGGKIIGLKLSGFAGLLGMEIQNNKRLGTDISEYAKSAGVKGMIHSDEDLKGKYGIEESEIKQIKSVLKCGERDAFVLIGDKENVARMAVNIALTRAEMQTKLAVPREVRKPEEDCTTTFLRPMPGSARLYPETDLPPIKIYRDVVDYLKSNLPEMWEDKIERFVREYKLNTDTATQMVKSDKADLFENVVRLGFDSNIIFRALTSMISELQDENLPVENLTDELIFEVFKKSPKTISKEGLFETLKTAAKTGKVEKAEIGLSETGLRKIIKDVISNNSDALQKHNPEQILMGEVMKIARGKADGKLVIKILKEEINK